MKILAVASTGGHWVQLLRLIPAFKNHETIYVSTKASFESTVPGSRFYSIPDMNRNNLLHLFQSILEIWKIISKIRPDIVITTGAAPGLLTLIIGKMRGCRTVWIDSMANIDELSLSGRIASFFADRVYTQWENLANRRVIYSGNILS